MQRVLASALAVCLAFPLPAQAMRFSIAPIKGSRLAPVISPLSLNIYRHGALTAHPLSLPEGTALPASAASPGLKVQAPLTPPFLSPGSVLPEIRSGRTRFQTAPADYLEDEHWTQELVDDPRYARILREGAEMLKHEDLVPAPQILERMRETDRKTYSHMMRVGIISGMIALLMGIPHDQARIIAWGGRLHDVGKMGEDVQAVINKKGKLDADERNLMQTHSYRGATLISMQDDIPLEIAEVAKVVALQHHERMNQVGYPYGVQGTRLSLASRITAAADYFDALLENRPYRSGLSMELAWEMQEGVREQFDPDVRDALRKLIEHSLKN